MAIGPLEKIAGRTKNQASIEAKCIEKPSGRCRLLMPNNFNRVPSRALRGDPSRLASGKQYGFGCIRPIFGHKPQML